MKKDVVTRDGFKHKNSEVLSIKIEVQTCGIGSNVIVNVITTCNEEDISLEGFETKRRF